MEYKGKLYGKVGNHTFPLLHTTDDWEEMEKQIKELKAENEALKQANGVSTGKRQLTKPAVINSVALPEWLNKERCAMAGAMWKSHQQGDNKRVKAVLLIREWAADAGYKIELKKAHELFEQHCL